jgi:hypothetical protein
MEGLCCNNRISQNPETSFALVRRYLRWMNHATPRQRITARRAGGGSARSTPRTKHGIIALSAKVMRVARDKRPDALSAATRYSNQVNESGTEINQLSLWSAGNRGREGRGSASKPILMTTATVTSQGVAHIRLCRGGNGLGTEQK